ncbi:cation transporting ATPase C-terminal domain-containing protein [Pseudoclavibacter sp. CFCC 13611]|uniref:cation transporting ATPase C-terminal domain-containing protein n=2 Tax=unclassified Pseudoclavibacter TaxID=2615177 RepID=UPI001300F809|nr:cation transporting ATPase C-terminal domain-containing protein [Pseudoclavibacter sp. CFCC 13611]KAB1663459.1 hypothetical protein F8O08_06870 [Pseudoclavibacter sp. CFCC 13611]
MFAVALAIGLTPQMLPAITSVSLATGARKMARRKVIVKRLDAIEDLGSVSVLCTDKTGTVTIGSAGLDLAADPSGRSDEAVGRLAVLNAGLQTGFANPLDQAVLAQATVPPSARAVGELPYDFSRKRLSVLVDGLDDELVRRPGQWNIAAIRNFMLVFGLLSAAFDIITFVVLMQVFHTDDVTFRSAWFLESTITELIVLFSMRSARPLFRTRPGRGLVVLSVIVGVFTLWVPYSPLAGVLGLDAVSGMLMAAVIVISLAYLACNELMKRRFIEALHRG